MLARLLLLFIAVPLIELYLLFALADQIGGGYTLALVIVTGVVGASLSRHQGWQTYRRIHEELARGEMPTDALLDAVMIFVAGAFLLTPGVLTDLVGFSLLIPYFRRAYRTRLGGWLKARIQVHPFTSHDASQPRQQGDKIIDSYVVDRTPPDEDSRE